MLYSLFVKFAMLGLTLGVVLWIGWTVPHSRYVEAERSSELGTLQDHPLRSSGPLAVSEAASSPAQRQDASRTTRPVAEKLDLNRATEQDLRPCLASVRCSPSGLLSIGKLVVPFATLSNCAV